MAGDTLGHFSPTWMQKQVSLRHHLENFQSKHFPKLKAAKPRNIYQKDGCWSWSSNTLSTWWEDQRQLNPETFIRRMDAEAEAPILCPPGEKTWLIGKDSDVGKDWGQEKKGMTEDETVGWHQGLNGHEFEQTLEVGNGQGSLVWCSPWGRRVRHDWATELNWSIS